MKFYRHGTMIWSPGKARKYFMGTRRVSLGPIYGDDDLRGDQPLPHYKVLMLAGLENYELLVGE